jgi:anti-sigma factor RsiW
MGEIESPEWRNHLTICPACAGKLREEADFDLILRHAVNEERLQTRQLESHVRAAIRKSMPWNRPLMVMVRYGIAAAVVFATVALGTIGYAKGRIDRNAICVDAVDDHQEEIVGKAPRKWRSNGPELQMLATKVAVDPTIPDRIAPAGYHLVGARICDLHGKRYMHLDYSDGTNEVSLFVRHNDAKKSVAQKVMHWLQSDSVATDRIDGFSVGAVQKHDLTLVAVAGSSLTNIHRIVEQAAEQL